MKLRTGQVQDVRLQAWGFDREILHELAMDTALHEVEPPDLELVLVANRGDYITVQVLKGEPPLPDGSVYVAKRGLYEILRAEKWPALAGAVAPRVLLTLRAFPYR